MKILVLGAGPAGLFAAHAAVQLGHEIIIMSKPRKSYMRGAQYLHRPIPGLSKPEDEFKVTYAFEGDIDVYRQKVYGPGAKVRVSPESLLGTYPAWDIRQAYDAAWSEFAGLVLPMELIGFEDELATLRKWANPDLIVSTVPAPLLCYQEHNFSSVNIWATDRAYGLPLDNTVLCNGDPEVPWYRKSKIQGYENTEYPDALKPPVERVWAVTKPIHTNCTCHPEVLRLGRYGLWEKGVLSDGAYYSLREHLEHTQETLF